jgi:hypothetical protein
MPNATQLEVVVDGRWLSLECRYGNVAMSTVWPGGSDELSWVLGTQPAHRFRGGETVSAYFGGLCVWSGQLIEPDPSQDQLTAEGAFREGDGYGALDGAGNATAVVDTAIDQAIARGLRWRRTVSIGSTATQIDISQGPVMVGALLDTVAENNKNRWLVSPTREVTAAPDPTSPAYRTNPLDNGLGFALDNYASTLIARYLDSTSNTYKTVTATDTDADANHGHVEDIISLTNRGAISALTATNITDRLLKRDRSIPQWTAPLQLSDGEILTINGTKVALETVPAGTMLRVHGGFELAQRLNGQGYLDMVIGRTQYADGALTITPVQIATRNLADFVARQKK